MADLSVVCVILIVLAILWLVGEFFPRMAMLARVCKILWVTVVTLVLCGLRITS